MSCQPFGERVGVFVEDRGLEFSGNFAESAVVACLDAGVVDGGVHDVGFHENDGAVVESVGEQVTDPEVGLAGDGADGFGLGRVGVGWQTADLGEGPGDGGSDEDFFLMGALEEFLEQGETLVGEQDFLVGVGTVQQKMEVGAVDENGLVRVAPGFGVEVEAEDEVGLERLVDEVGAGADFGGAVEEAFGLGFDARRVDGAASSA